VVAGPTASHFDVSDIATALTSLTCPTDVPNEAMALVVMLLACGGSSLSQN
jgi:hypothetical protein